MLVVAVGLAEVWDIWLRLAGVSDPGIAIMLTIFGLNLFGDGLRDLLDPEIRGLSTERQRAA